MDSGWGIPTSAARAERHGRPVWRPDGPAALVQDSEYVGEL